MSSKRVYDDPFMIYYVYTYNRGNKSLAYHRLQSEGRSQETKLSKCEKSFCPKKRRENIKKVRP